MNFSSTHAEDYFISKDFMIEPVKNTGVFEPYRWLEEFGKNLTRNIIEAKIVHTTRGLTLPIKRFSTSQNKQTVEFAGLRGYSDKSNLISELLKELWIEIQNEVITRVDVAIDFKSKIPAKVIKELGKNRISFKYLNTTYSKTAKEKKTNPHLDIKIYDKALHANLDYTLERLEFCFKGAYFRGMCTVKELDKFYIKMQKTIKRMCGLDVEIIPFKICL
ncbi:hypothetical protein [Sulfurimonas sp.]|uniref:hypothetical protein n=1 Tax=Sulfurimonas sp. TaxID=2022749 RepID=UPI0025D09B2E|nr:hypothetical protein [Sulfurimonas sp.]MBT5934978.1 hypothetical protein [Sulfurimonas sp.]